MTGNERLVIAAVAVVVLTLVGGLLPLVREWSRSTIRLFLAFGTGVLLGAAFFHMLPEAIHGLGEAVGFPLLAGFLLIYVLERFVMVHPCEEEGCSFHHMGLAAFCGITLHALIDGLALGAGVAIPELSVAVTMAIVLHKLPASLSLTGILIHCSYPRSRILWMLAVFALATPVGAVLSLTLLRNLTGDALHYAVAFSAGTFLAIATADLLPQVHTSPEGRYRNLLALFAGILVMTFAGRGHQHGPVGPDPDHDHAGAPDHDHDHDHDHAVAPPRNSP